MENGSREHKQRRKRRTRKRTRKRSVSWIMSVFLCAISSFHSTFKCTIRAFILTNKFSRQNIWWRGVCIEIITHIRLITLMMNKTREERKGLICMSSSGLKRQTRWMLEFPNECFKNLLVLCCFPLNFMSSLHLIKWKAIKGYDKN